MQSVTSNFEQLLQHATMPSPQRSVQSCAVLVSGGLDSAVLLWHVARSLATRAVAVTFHYGERHSREVEYAQRLAERLGVEHYVFHIPELREVFGDNALTGDVEVPTGPYTPETIRYTVVPGRNLVLLSLAAAFASARGIDFIAYAAHANDTNYPDCRPEFVEAALNAIELATLLPHRVWLIAPFTLFRKAEIVRLGAAYGVPFELTWSCYRGEKKHCGVCPTCIDRKTAFAQAGVKDPTSYEA